MELKDWLGVASLGISLISAGIAVALWLRKTGAQSAHVDHRLGSAASREELQKYVTKEALAEALESALAQAALKYHEKTATHELVDRTAKEVYDRINRLNDTLQNAMHASTSSARDKTEALNVQVQVLKEGVASVSDGLETLEKIVSELLTKNADHGARLIAQEQMRVAFETVRVQVAKIEGLLAKSGKTI